MTDNRELSFRKQSAVNGTKLIGGSNEYTLKIDFRGLLRVITSQKTHKM